ncbi:transposase [Geomonas anaerohicana]|uniref:Transposase n=1 Tax=Geomonas anaerohicana TaxID=2798583 RepID=A0ABS0YKS6_9BACT|nr:transposase [Geomonas anaerohicana]MBJ6752871.1 transposase [Geomonas anaerohicana]
MAKMVGPRKIHSYSKEFKSTAVRLSSLPGVHVHDVAEALLIHPNVLTRWRKEFREGTIKHDSETALDSGVVSDLKRLRELEKEHARLKVEHELLKKAIRFCSEQKSKSSPSSSRTGKPTA